MAMVDEVITRVATHTLLELVRTDDHLQEDSATVTNTNAVLVAAVADAEAEFFILSGFDPDSGVPSHVAAVVTGVLYYLMTWKAKPEGEIREHHIRFERLCRAMRDVFTAVPKSSSALTPSDEVQTGKIRRPDMDRANFRHYLPGSFPRDQFRDR
jgi:hypothetical protein